MRIVRTSLGMVAFRDPNAFRYMLFKGEKFKKNELLVLVANGDLKMVVENV